VTQQKIKTYQSFFVRERTLDKALLCEMVPLHTEGKAGSVIRSSGLKSKWDRAVVKWRWGRPLLQGPPRQGQEQDDASCAQHGPSSRPLVLCHVEKPVLIREGLGEW